MYAIYVDNFDRAKFFSRIAQDIDDEFIFFTTKFSAHLYLSRQFRCYLIRNQSSATATNCNTIYDQSRLSNFTHVYRGTQTKEQAKIVYDHVYSFLHNHNGSFSGAFVFNGNSASQSAFVDHFRSKSTPVIFCEISNLPGKVLFDPEGVNAKSILYNSPNILDQLPEVEDLKHNNWLEYYNDYKKKPIPQGKQEPKFVFAYIIDYVSSIFGIGIREESISLLKKISSTFKLITSKSKSQTSFEYDSLDEPFVFFPTQVRYDSQLIINSDINNVDAIHQAYEIAESYNCRLLVKVHPAEQDIEILKEYKYLQKKLGFKLVSNNTNDLIVNAKHVVVINSTVGLESLLLHKGVTVLGRAIYTNFDYERVKKYVHHYLINFEYFSDDFFDTDEFNKVKKYLRMR
ncbi:hypothetical protein [Vibrio genomosp. F6]|uniref:Capsular biosynthesis protein n=1 Tax=Vibrio genomosp. F6 str. FF-238 TaxID=1191298 RepID=A0A1E5D2G9_9VIBR|nr:hypothetical protein [Vibrio genomosp. F6]OEE77712.1 hypothetical protein A130_14370 [Vibrio genomosp. F6 str. FF-238]